MPQRRIKDVDADLRKVDAKLDAVLAFLQELSPTGGQPAQQELAVQPEPEVEEVQQQPTATGYMSALVQAIQNEQAIAKKSMRAKYTVGIKLGKMGNTQKLTEAMQAQFAGWTMAHTFSACVEGVKDGHIVMSASGAMRADGTYRIPADKVQQQEQQTVKFLAWFGARSRGEDPAKLPMFAKVQMNNQPEGFASQVLNIDLPTPAAE